MGGNQHPQETEASEAFCEWVKDALGHLHDLGYLQHHPLALHRKGNPAILVGQRLRRELVSAIEAVNPGRGVSFHAPHARPYNLLVLRYMDRITLQEAARELGVSPRHARRALRQGEKSVAAVLWARRSARLAQNSGTLEVSSLEAEMARLENRFRPIDVRVLLERAQRSVEPLAVQRDVRLQVEIPPEPVVLSIDALIAAQVLVNILSRALGQSQSGILYLTLTPRAGQVCLTLRYLVEPAAVNALVADHTVARLADRARWAIEQKDRPDGTRVATLHMTTQPSSSTVLVIDDNQGLLDLLERYLTDQACRVIPATSGKQGLQLAQEVLPDAIVLDVMMPEMHGWELLQRLHNDPRTTSIPVIICSVIDNPELAQALGASAFLPKPIRQDDILAALCQIGVM